MFKPVESKVSFPQIEEKILAFWKENKIFEKSVESRPKNKQWNFLDGPPFITGLPHYGTLLVSIPKDLFPRFWTMKGYRVRRVWGWDVHGLPAENKVETKLGLTRKRDIEEKIGIKKFIELCREYVSESSKEWEWYVDHIARWVDFQNAYKTMDLTYMETVMWVFKQMYDKGHIYKGLRVSLYCPHCSTPISNFEVAMDPDNYNEITEQATTYKYELKDEPGTYILAWSTTPWNKIVTPALAVNPNLTYVKIKQGNEKYILAVDSIKRIIKDKFEEELTASFKGATLIGKKFIPHYDFYKIDSGKKAFEIVAGDFVTADEGTGVVTIAAYGEEDLVVMQKENIQIVQHVDEEGKLTKGVPKWAGMYYLDVNPLVNEDLASRNLIYRDEKYAHTVPTCWRCHTRLFYAPQDAWFVDVQKLKKHMKQTNELVNWFPSHFKEGRFLKSLEAAPDWNISRTRYWGSPVPVWECECGERTVPGSVVELEKLSGTKITDLHKPEIDEVVIPCPKCGTKTNRVPEVLDSWIEAGSAAFAERHFPFEKELKLSDFFPPDFIVEYTGQIRAWFYVLHVIANALYGTNAFKNVVVTGVILGTDGRKMSKNYGNYPDPKEMLQKYGGDALRLYLMGSPVMHGEDILISEEQYRNQVKDFFLILWNTYKFFLMYANIDGWTRDKKTNKRSDQPLDKWILLRLHSTINSVTVFLNSYDTVGTVKELKEFINDLSTWYIRRSRDRIGPTAENQTDKKDFYSTSYEVLVTISKLLAPITPFIAEEIYKNLTEEESVHLTDWPVADEQLLTHAQGPFMTLMKNAREAIEKGHAERKKLGIKVRQPLASVEVKGPGLINKDLWFLIKDELNVKNITWRGDAKDWQVTFDLNISPELKAEGQAREIVRQIQTMRKEAGCKLDEKISVTLPKEAPKAFEDYIKRETLAKTIVWGDHLDISTLS